MLDQPIEARPDSPKRVRVAPNLYQRAADGRYECGYTDPTSGKWRMVTLKSARNLTEAKAAVREILGKRDRRELVVPTRMTFGEVWLEYEATNESLAASGDLSDRTTALYAQRYKSHLKTPLGRVKIQAVSARHLSEVLATMRRRGLSSWTIRSVLTLAGSILGHAVEQGYRADNPIKQLSKRERPEAKNATQPRALTADEVGALIDACTDTHRPIITTLAFCGLRAQEVLGLRWQDVELGEASVVHIRAQLTRPTREKPAHLVPLKSDAGVRSISIPPALARVLAGHKLASRFSSDNDFVFCTEQGRPLGYRFLSRGLNKAADEGGLNPEGVQRLSPHDLRHTAITALIMAGCDVGTVAKYAGHSKPSMTLDRYLHVFQAQRGNDVADRLGTAFASVL